MENPNRSIRAFAIGLILYGAINLLGNAGYGDFKILCKGFPEPIILAIYIFGIGYGIMGILCGTRILRFENWARKTAIGLVLMSLLIGLLITPQTLKNLELFHSENIALQNVSLRGLVKTYISFAVIFTLFEISFIYFFTRLKIKGYFK